MALALVPQPPLEQWFAELDSQIARAPGFFNNRPVVIDITFIPRNDPDLARLIGLFTARGVRVLGVEGAEQGFTPPASWNWPPLLSGGRPVAVSEVPEEKPAPEPNNLIRDGNLRSGQSIIFPKGDVTVVGSAGFGTEIVAGGSIHVYGALRGRAIAGAMGDAKARIFCRKLEAELIAIDGIYQTADGMPEKLRGKAAKISLDGDKIVIESLD